MAACVETMFYYNVDINGQRFTPWHGLGIEVNQALTSKDALVAAGLDWSVNKKPIYDGDGKVIKGFYANTRDTDAKVLGIVSDRYSIVQNADAFEFTDSLVSEGLTYHTAGSLRKGKQIWLLAKLPETKILGDDIDPYICFTNTFDNSGAVRVIMTPTRVVCQNTLNLAISSAKRSWSARHVGNIMQKLEEAKDTLKLSKIYMENLDKEANKLALKKVTIKDFEAIIDNIYPTDKIMDSQRKLDNVAYIRDSLIKCLDAPDLANFKDTAWGIVNATADFVDHVSPLRLTKNYQENQWSRMLNTNNLLDSVYERVAA